MTGIDLVPVLGAGFTIPGSVFAVEAGVPICCSTDAHSIRGLGNMRLSVATARRGWATAADVLNTGPLEAILASS